MGKSLTPTHGRVCKATALGSRKYKARARRLIAWNPPHTGDILSPFRGTGSDLSEKLPHLFSTLLLHYIGNVPL